MIFVIDKKLYDTQKMECVGYVKKWYSCGFDLFGSKAGRTYDCKLWRSQKGNYLLTHSVDYEKNIGEAISECEAQELLLRYDYIAYEKLFGEIEEA